MNITGLKSLDLSRNSLVSLEGIEDLTLQRASVSTTSTSPPWWKSVYVYLTVVLKYHDYIVLLALII